MKSSIKTPLGTIQSILKNHFTLNNRLRPRTGSTHSEFPYSFHSPTMLINTMTLIIQFQQDSTAGRALPKSTSEATVLKAFNPYSLQPMEKYNIVNSSPFCLCQKRLPENFPEPITVPVSWLACPSSQGPVLFHLVSGGRETNCSWRDKRIIREKQPNRRLQGMKWMCICLEKIRVSKSMLHDVSGQTCCLPKKAKKDKKETT